MPFRLTTRPGHPTFVELPWREPLSDWALDCIVTPVRGIHRHVVKFIELDGAMYALKELQPKVAEREFRLLRELDQRSVPVVDAVGVAAGRETRDGTPLDAILITRHLDFSLPFRALFARASLNELWNPLLDSLAELLVRIHLAGFFWGDCSLSNTLFRRDAGSLAATLVDAETGELHSELSRGQRRHDLQIAELNVAGELLDLAEAASWGDAFDAGELASDLLRRYHSLWDELTGTRLIAKADRYHIDSHVRRLNELGFDVDELQIEPLEEGFRVNVRTAVVEPGHHSRRLLQLTGLDVQENQARRLLNDIRGYRAYLERTGTTPVSEALGALRWMHDLFEPTVASIPPELRGKLEPAELFHQVLEHRWFLSEARGVEAKTSEAVEHYIEDVLRTLPDEQQVLLDEDLDLDLDDATS